MLQPNVRLAEFPRPVISVPPLAKHQPSVSPGPYTRVVWAGLGLQTPPSASKALCLAVTLILKCAYFIFKGKPHLVGVRA